MDVLTFLADWVLTILGGAIIGLAWVAFFYLTFQILRDIWTGKTPLFDKPGEFDDIGVRIRGNSLSMMVLGMLVIGWLLLTALGLWLIKLL
jgi:hypothetical protein